MNKDDSLVVEPHLASAARSGYDRGRSSGGKVFMERGWEDAAPEVLGVGAMAEMVRVVGESDVEAFAAVSGDFNPVHLDEAYAQTTLMKGRVVHGALLGGFISALLGSRLPGPGAIYLSQTLNFKRPVRIGDEVTVRVSVDRVEGETVTLATACLVRRKIAVDGQAVVRVAGRTSGRHRHGAV